MTEKSYGGNNGVREHLGKNVKNKSDSIKLKKRIENTKANTGSDADFENESDNGYEEIENYKQAGKIAVKVLEFAKDLIKPDMKLLEIARKIEGEIIKLGGEVAFPVNLSIDDIAAHYHPTIEDETGASGLLKVDIGIHINGCVADCAFSLDLTEDKKYKELIKASEDALEKSLSLIEKYPDSTLNDIGKTIQESILKKGFSPIVNLSGHSLGSYTIHAGVTIPNYPNGSNYVLEEGGYAIEPFATTGEGKIYEGPSSNIFSVVNFRNPRSPIARKILDYAGEKYRTLPFSLREIQEKFGPMARIGMRELEQLGVLHNFPQLIEKSHHPVSQAEHTFFKTSKGKIILITK